MTADTVIPAKAGTQYPDNGMGSTVWSAMLETASRCSRWSALHKTGYWIAACAAMTDGGHVARCFCG